jgi:probable HAF family extracellular repeat protein
MWQPDDSLVDLGSLGGNYSQAFGINNVGQVVGFSSTSASPQQLHAFVWDASTGMHDLGQLGGADTFATAINDGGDVVGYSANCTDTCHWRAFEWRADIGMQALPMSAGFTATLANAINEQGQVVGQCNLSPTVAHACLWLGDDGSSG